MCHKTLSVVGDTFADTRACPACKYVFETSEAKEPPAESQQSNRVLSHTADTIYVLRKLSPYGLWLVGFMLIVGAAEHNWLIWLGSLLIGTGAVILARQWTGPKVSLVVGVSFGAAVLFLMLWYGTYEARWSKDEFYYFDTYSRWNGRHIHRRMRAEQPNGIVRTEGYLSPSGKLHGPWKTTGPNFESHVEHYWYGEPITEGEWHLRN